jgi:hypothetical protein
MTRGQEQPIGEVHFGKPSGLRGAAEMTDGTLASASTTTIAHWNSSFVSNGKTYAYAMVGTSPMAKPAKASVIDTEIQPLAFKFSDGTVIHGTTVSSSIANSPIFLDTKFPTGTGQYGDIIQRANFAKYATTDAYHVQLALPHILPEIQVVVPKASGHIGKAKNGVTFGLIDFSFVTKTIAAMATNGKYNAQTLPIFATGNVFLYNQIDVLCCYLGYHDAAAKNGSTVTYIFTSYPSPGLFSAGFQDVAVLSHETAEWINDPFGTNVTRPWSTVQQPGYCFSDLIEVGDAIENFPNANFTVSLNGKTFHVQDVAFLSWFTGETPSSGAGGRYSYLAPAKLKKHAQFCD